MRAQSTALGGSRRGLPCTRANSPAQTSLQTAGLCEPMAVGLTGRARASWLAHSCLSGLITSVASSAAWRVSVFKVMLYCTLEAFPRLSPTQHFSSQRPWKADSSTGAPGQEECGERGRRASSPPNQRAGQNSSPHTRRETRGNRTAPVGDGHQGGSGDPGSRCSLQALGQVR